MVTARRADAAARSGAASHSVRESSRARYPDRSGYVVRHGVRVFYEVYGEGDPALVFAPSWSIVHSRVWKAQVPTFARRHRVVTFDPRGNGRSDRPAGPEAYAEAAFAADLIAVMDAAAVERAVVIALSMGAHRALIAAAEHPERVSGLVFIGPAAPLGDGLERPGFSFEDVIDGDDGWALYNRHAWLRDYRRFLEFFFGECFTEPHSTKPIEDAVGWGLEIDPETLIATEYAPGLDRDRARELCASVRCPTLVIQGDADAITGPGRGIGLAEAIPGARLVMIAGGGHIPNVRDPVRVNLLIRDFVRALGPTP